MRAAGWLAGFLHVGLRLTGGAVKVPDSPHVLLLLADSKAMTLIWFPIKNQMPILCDCWCKFNNLVSSRQYSFKENTTTVLDSSSNTILIRLFLAESSIVHIDITIMSVH